MNQYLDAKCKYKRIFKYSSPAGHEIVYRLLTWNEYLSYTSTLQSGGIPSYYIEEKIFKDCVLDDMYGGSIDLLYAGDVLTVTGLILHESGPQSIESIDEKLEEKRELVGSITNQITALICQAFPGYTPDDIENMNWDDVSEKLALAESILISQGILGESLQISGKSTKKIKAGPIDFSRANKDLAQSDSGPPPGDWNMNRRRAQ